MSCTVTAKKNYCSIKPRTRRSHKTNRRQLEKEDYRTMKQLRIIFPLSIFFFLEAGFSPGFFGEVNAKEVNVTDEWHLLQEGETVPAGAHIKMDMSSGEKWVKKMSSQEEQTVEVSADGSSTIISSTAVMSIPEETNNNMNNNIYKAGDDILMMYRVLSKLPPEEIGDEDGLPTLPTFQDDKHLFESKLRALWEHRQQTLAALTEQNDFDDIDSNSTRSAVQQLQLPKLLARYIKKIRLFVSQRHASCYGPLVREHLEGEQEMVDFTDLLFILSELEYHLTDIDAARDFHTLGGWPVLGFLLTSPQWFWEGSCLRSKEQYYPNNRSENNYTQIEDDGLIIQEREQLQTAVLWAIGNAVKNHAEFSTWSLEPISIHPIGFLDSRVMNTTNLAQLQSDGHHTTVLSLLLDMIQTYENQQATSSHLKALYALGSILRGNLNVQEKFVEMGGCLILGNYLQNALSLKSYKIVARILSLAHDILTEVQHYMTDSTSQTKSSLKVVALGFTGELWCQSTYQMFQIQYRIQNNTSVIETVLRTVESMITYCQKNFPKESTEEILQDLKSRWSISSKEALDDDWRNDLLELVNSIESKLYI